MGGCPSPGDALGRRCRWPLRGPRPGSPSGGPLGIPFPRGFPFPGGVLSPSSPFPGALPGGAEPGPPGPVGRAGAPLHGPLGRNAPFGDPVPSPGSGGPPAISSSPFASEGRRRKASPPSRARRAPGEGKGRKRTRRGPTGARSPTGALCLRLSGGGPEGRTLVRLSRRRRKRRGPGAGRLSLEGIRRSGPSDPGGRSRGPAPFGGPRERSRRPRGRPGGTPAHLGGLSPALALPGVLSGLLRGGPLFGRGRSGGAHRRRPGGGGKPFGEEAAPAAPVPRGAPSGLLSRPGGVGGERGLVLVASPPAIF
ncbi:MAG: hypothetical protein BWY88_00281 [Synergistetes bacterium ADurb.Bin520]|nr:MAG: hypothetical protein BWY88_00281 [Synergistetes bacterium ADurb.Bin520]